MKHAGSEALSRLSPLLARLENCAPLVEKSPGVYHLKSRAFLHFHEDPTGLFADVRFEDDFERLPASTRAQQAVLLQRIVAHLAERASRAKPSAKPRKRAVRK